MTMRKQWLLLLIFIGKLSVVFQLFASSNEENLDCSLEESFEEVEPYEMESFNATFEKLKKFKGYVDQINEYAFQWKECMKQKNDLEDQIDQLKTKLRTIKFQLKHNFHPANIFSICQNILQFLPDLVHQEDIRKNTVIDPEHWVQGDERNTMLGDIIPTTNEQNIQNNFSVQNPQQESQKIQLICVKQKTPKKKLKKNFSLENNKGKSSTTKGTKKQNKDIKRIQETVIENEPRKPFSQRSKLEKTTDSIKEKKIKSSPEISFE